MTTNITEDILIDLTAYGQRIVNNKLVAGPGGNISHRDGDLMWISPSGYSFDELSKGDWVAVDITTGETLPNQLRPSSEIAMHLEIYRSRPEINAIVHTHPPYTIGIISTEYNEIPPMFPDYVALVGKVPYIDYVVPCSDELAQAVKKVLQDKNYQALFLKNHGLITLGSNLKQAYVRSEIIEDAAKIFWVSKSVGTPKVLSPSDIAEISESDAEKYRQNLMEEG
ncbi:class II aldolase/adducin family protein [Scopulibacillus cellulosilyticus]|uniref:Class II aldolase/adducin family protein n=1 Tax=Scopulibacillus cellulosilyticus TaxID=2665665 RepID=A0ABW2Q1J3_9BACL